MGFSLETIVVFKRTKHILTVPRNGEMPPHLRQQMASKQAIKALKSQKRLPIMDNFLSSKVEDSEGRWESNPTNNCNSDSHQNG